MPSDATQDAEEVRYPCTFPETDHDALFGNLLAIVRQRDAAREALREAIELAEDYAQYVSDFLLAKWGHADDIARLKAVLNDGDVCADPSGIDGDGRG